MLSSPCLDYAQSQAGKDQQGMLSLLCVSDLLLVVHNWVDRGIVECIPATSGIGGEGESSFDAIGTRIVTGWK